MLIKSLYKKMLVGLDNIFCRFSISVGVIIILTATLLVSVHGDFDRETEDIIARIVLSLIITFFFSVAVYIHSEKISNKYFNYRILFQLIPILFGFWMFFEFDINFNKNLEGPIFFILNLVGIIFYLFFAPYVSKIFSKNKDQLIYYSYFYKIGVIFLISSILSGVLCILGFMGIFATFSLFDIKGFAFQKIYTDWAILSMALIPPIFALINIPQKESFDKNMFIENAFFSFLTKYIAIPFIIIYFIILYSYSLKVLLNFNDWPKGEVSWLVIGFSTFGYLIYMFSYIFEEKNLFVRIFRNILPFAIIPQLFMLFYAIYLRINQYDLTINRYFVVVFGFWLTITSFYLILSKYKYLGFIPFLLTIFTIIISIGPWSVYNLPEQRQFTRLENNLKKAGILINGKITPLKNYSDINEKLGKDIYDGIDYLCDFDNCNKIKTYFKDVYKPSDKGVRDYAYSNWGVVEDIAKSIKVKKFYETNLYEDQFLYFRIKGTSYGSDIFPLEIKNFSKILKISSNLIQVSEYANFNLNEQTLEIFQNNNITEKINLSPFIKKIYEKFEKTNNTDLDKQDLTFENKKYKIIFTTIKIINPKYKKQNDKNDNLTEYDRGYSDGFLLVR